VIPVSDTVRSRTFPYVNLAIIVATFLVFFYEISLSEQDLNQFFFDHGVVPRRLADWWDSPSGLEQPLTVITSAFIHGGWLHILGNMLYLWVFGDNVEDALGHVKYAVFYAVAAIGAVALQVAVDTGAVIPMVGASGAIAGVLGAYLVLYPRATVGVVVPFVWFFGPLPLPAIFLIGFWFVMQLFTGFASIGTATGASEGVAVWAHVGGFITGFAIVAAARPLIRVRPLPPGRRTGQDIW
jgi:membrane associated rhomboid family serine protease